MHLIQLLLPAVRGADTNSDRFAATRRELVEHFDGVTAYVRAPAQGIWVAPAGDAEQDDVVMVEVVVDSLDRAWWRAYAETLADRFEQQVIHIRVIAIELI